MVLPRQLAVCLLDLLGRGGFAYAEHGVGIFHSLHPQLNKFCMDLFRIYHPAVIAGEFIPVSGERGAVYNFLSQTNLSSRGK